MVKETSVMSILTVAESLITYLVKDRPPLLVGAVHESIALVGAATAEPGIGSFGIDFGV